MTSQTRATLKGYFNTNDQPTEAQFADLIDSTVNVSDDPAFRVNVLFVDSAGTGTYTTLSGALAAITDAAANKRYTVIVSGQVAETDTVTAKSYVDVVGLGQATVTITNTTTLHRGVTFSGITNATWRNLKIVRAGAFPIGTEYGAHAVYLDGATDATLRFVNCVFQATMTGGAGSNSGGGFHNTGSPVFVNCQFIGSDTTSSCGVAISDAAAPEFIGCLMRGGGVGVSCYGTRTDTTAAPTFLSCNIYGGAATAGYGYGASATGSSTPTYTSCSIIGGSGGTYGIGANVEDTAIPTFANCTIRGGAGGAASHGVWATKNSAPRFSSCYIKAGTTGICYATLSNLISAPQYNSCTTEGGYIIDGCINQISDNSAPVFRNCTNVLAQEAPTYVLFDATGTFVISAKPCQLAAMSVFLLAAGTGSAKLSVGTTLAGTDIINALAIDGATGWQAATLGAGALTLFAGSATIYVTISGTGSPSLRIYYNTYTSYSACQAFLIDSIGAVRIAGGAYVSNAASDCVYIHSLAVTANKLHIGNAAFTARPAAASSRDAINAGAAYNPAPIYNCTLVGGSNNITAAAGTANGSNIEC